MLRILFIMVREAWWAYDVGLIREVPRLHSIRHAAFEWGSSGRVIGPTQKSLLDITQQSQESDINVPGGVSNPKFPQASSNRPTP